MILSIIAIVVLVSLDQFVKYLTVTHLMLKPIVLIENIFELTYVENKGAAWSILENQIWFFILMTVIILALIAYAFYKKMIYTKLGQISLVLICAGAIGNLIDRITHGYVIDMFSFKLINFPVFNVADICIVCGGILFVYYMMFQHDKYAEKAGKK
ncbi:MAG TPA: signal peptidase II [Candidatus Butyricicoccus avistercoris]|uniref:Lipoprotein signal peptidase n=1 Tax=Candidatus Butyricicoccus avistercoris TaxID=2838518 RepID=A0A9D1PIV3_9FIRM|nr:signal peptidase II [Candidatus Butyricicoccus avistercoris]